MKNQKGMTLLELSLAMAMVGILVLGMSSFSGNLGRVLLNQKQDMGILQDYSYAFNRANLLVERFISDHTNYDVKISFDDSTKISRIEFLEGSTHSLVFEALQTNSTSYLKAILTEELVEKLNEYLLSTPTVKAAAFVPEGNTVTAAARDACLASPNSSGCFVASCGALSSIDFTKSDCILNSTFPFFQIQNSSFGAIFYLSLKVLRNNVENGLVKKIGITMTKAIPLNREVTRRPP